MTLSEMLIKNGGNVGCGCDAKSKFTTHVFSFASEVIADYTDLNGELKESDYNVDIVNAVLDGLAEFLG